MKPAVVCQPLSKFDMFTFLFHTLCISLCFSSQQTRFLDFWCKNTKEGSNFQRNKGEPTKDETMVQR